MIRQYFQVVRQKTAILAIEALQKETKKGLGQSKEINNLLSSIIF